MDLKNIGKKIKSERQKKDISQMKLAEMSNISSVHLSHIETGKVTMSLECLVNVCKALGITPNYVLLDEYSANSIENNYLDEYLNCLTKDEITYLLETSKLLSLLKINRKG